MTRRFAACVAAALALAAPASAGASTVFTLSGHGWGHGIGMSQYGALGYAEHGWGYRQIMGHYFTGTHVAPLGRSATERVLLSSGANVDFGASGRIALRDAAGTRMTLAAGSYRLQEGGRAGHLQLVAKAGGAVTKGLAAPVSLSPGSQPLRLDDSAGIGFAGDHWHGSFRVVESGSSLWCVNVVGIEKYVRGVVPSEMPASWPLPALKAQAVAARSYAVATRNPSGAFDAYADTRSQVYGPIEHEASASNAAVAATARRVVWYRGAVATTFFSSSSGGRTSSEQAAWDTTAGQPYLVPVIDRYDSANGANPYHTWPLATYTGSGLARALGLSGSVTALATTVDRKSQRVLKLGVTTSGGSATLDGVQVQGRLGLRSVWFRLVQRTLTAPSTAVAGSGDHPLRPGVARARARPALAPHRRRRPVGRGDEPEGACRRQLLAPADADGGSRLPAAHGRQGGVAAGVRQGPAGAHARGRERALPRRHVPRARGRGARPVPADGRRMGEGVGLVGRQARERRLLDAARDRHMACPLRGRRHPPARPLGRPSPSRR